MAGRLAEERQWSFNSNNVTALASPLHQQSPGAGRVHRADLKLAHTLTHWPLTLQFAELTGVA